jgi:hypothetical protein
MLDQRLADVKGYRISPGAFWLSHSNEHKQRRMSVSGGLADRGGQQLLHAPIHGSAPRTASSISIYLYLYLYLHILECPHYLRLCNHSAYSTFWIISPFSTTVSTHISRGARNLSELDAHRAVSVKTSLANPRYLTSTWSYSTIYNAKSHNPVPRSILAQFDPPSTSSYHHTRQTVRR